MCICLKHIVLNSFTDVDCINKQLQEIFTLTENIHDEIDQQSYFLI